MSEYVGIAPTIGGWSHVGVIFLMNTFDRTCGLFQGKRPPRCLIEAAYIDAGYIIDAPEEIPAGGCVGFTVQDDPDFALAEQLTVHREVIARVVVMPTKTAEGER